MSRYLLYVSQPYSIAVLEPLQNVIHSRGQRAAWFFEQPEHALELDKRGLVLKSVSEVQHFDPHAVFVPGNLVPDFFPGLKVEVFHGFGIEKKGHFKIRGLMDLYCTHGPATTLPFTALARKHGSFQVVETGWPKVDPLFHSRNKVKPQKQSPTRPLILYAPTFSPALSSAPALLEEVQRLSRELPFQWLVKFHPKMQAGMVERYRRIVHEKLGLSEHANILPLLLKADLLLTDTSSVISEFLLLNKPVITFKTRRPLGHTRNITEAAALQKAIEETLANPALSEAAKAFIENIHPYQDGKSSERVLDATEKRLELGPQGLKKKPLNLLRKLKIRTKLKYYRL